MRFRIELRTGHDFKASRFEVCLIRGKIPTVIGNSIDCQGTDPLDAQGNLGLSDDYASYSESLFQRVDFEYEKMIQSGSINPGDSL